MITLEGYQDEIDEILSGVIEQELGGELGRIKKIRIGKKAKRFFKKAGRAMSKIPGVSLVKNLATGNMKKVVAGLANNPLMKSSIGKMVLASTPAGAGALAAISVGTSMLGKPRKAKVAAIKKKKGTVTKADIKALDDVDNAFKKVVESKADTIKKAATAAAINTVAENNMEEIKQADSENQEHTDDTMNKYFNEGAIQ